MNRREFINGAGAFAAVATTNMPTFAATASDVKAMLLHSGRNMWGDWKAP